MNKYFKEYSLELEKEELEKFEQFLVIFKEKNAQVNLSAIRDNEGIIKKHFVDSIMLNAFIDLEGNVADLGTGGGFPLIPLAITNPKVSFTGIDSVGKKLKAIDDFSLDLGLKNITTLNGRAEELGHNDKYRENFDFIVSRATAYFPTLLEYAIPLLKVGGTFIAYKLDDKEELKTAKKALARFSSKIEVIKNYEIDGQKRTLVFIRKEVETQKKYPRTIGIPSKMPIK